ncbi:PREDICTED: uncharacterized protein LOC109116900 [Tarenaya hassleriana]|uniref:uncharacterized protein LOC109116900 n=1 Tax=Tarenaya hassleriana TaxID=28532 RepID=UPI0008FD09FC|nr:PREDICTED: uncharacterized protein LOC109116900 [Tarenaya hassleriana]
MGGGCCMTSSEDGGMSPMTGFVLALVLALSLLAVCSSHERRVSVRMVRCR